MSRLGRYTLLRKVGAGGMAEIWKARAEGPAGFAKIVAIKRILSHLGEDEEFIQMFVEEAKLVARLVHPNIVQVFDFNQAEGSAGGAEYFITMEYVAGQNLATILRRLAQRGRTLPARLALFAISEMSKALGYAHDEGIVHRDVSPHNVLVSYRGEVKITDFGIAKVASAHPRTATGMWKGKVLYLSPEQAKLIPLDGRSDLFSAGVVMHELFSGRRLFADADSEGIYQKVVRFRAPSAEDLRDVPEAARPILERALQVDREARYPHAREMEADLHAQLQGSGPAVREELAALMRELFEAECAAEGGEPTSSEGRPAPAARATSTAASASRGASTEVDRPAEEEGARTLQSKSLLPDATWLQAIAEHENRHELLTRLEGSPDFRGGTEVASAAIAGEATATRASAPRDAGATRIGPGVSDRAAGAVGPTAGTSSPTDAATVVLGVGGETRMLGRPGTPGERRADRMAAEAAAPGAAAEETLRGAYESKSAAERSAARGGSMPWIALAASGVVAALLLGLWLGGRGQADRRAPAPGAADRRDAAAAHAGDPARGGAPAAIPARADVPAASPPRADAPVAGPARAGASATPRIGAAPPRRPATPRSAAAAETARPLSAATPDETDDRFPLDGHFDDPVSDRTQRLEALKRLHDDGIISDAEYDERRKKILEEM